MGFDIQLFIVAGVISTLVSGWLLRTAERAPRALIPGNHRLAILQYGAVVRWSCLGLAGILAALTAVVLTPALYPLIGAEEALPMPLRFASLVLLLAALALLAEARTRRVILTSDAIASLGAFSRSALRWDEVVAVRFNPYLRMLVFHSRDGRRLTVNPSLSGLAFLETLTLTKLPAARCAPAFRALHQYRGL